jgi:outer membrane lipoprotein
LVAVRETPEQFIGTAVRWGGAIVSVRNLKDETVVEIVSRQLDGDGRPRAEDQSEGRFLAQVTGFLDPAVYAGKREVTVSGRVAGALRQSIGEFPYQYPIVRVEQIYLWEPRLQPNYDPYRNDPWYPWGYPYWPYRPWYR